MCRIILVHKKRERVACLVVKESSQPIHSGYNWKRKKHLLLLLCCCCSTWSKNKNKIETLKIQRQKLGTVKNQLFDRLIHSVYSRSLLKLRAIYRKRPRATVHLSHLFQEERKNKNTIIYMLSSQVFPTLNEYFLISFVILCMHVAVPLVR